MWASVPARDGKSTTFELVPCGGQGVLILGAQSELTHRRGEDGSQITFDIHMWEDNHAVKVDIDVALVVADISSKEGEANLPVDIEHAREASPRAVYFVFIDPVWTYEHDAPYYRLQVVRCAYLCHTFGFDHLRTGVYSSWDPALVAGDLATAIFPPPRSPTTVKDVLSFVYEKALDWFARCLSYPIIRPADVSSKLDYVTDNNHMDALINNESCDEWEKDIISRGASLFPNPSCPVHLVPIHGEQDAFVVAKTLRRGEREAMVLAEQLLPVPRVYRHDLKWTVMDYIRGPTLLSCWEELSRIEKLRVACTLRVYVRRMRTLQRAYPGDALDGHLNAQFFCGELGDRRFGPFGSVDDFRRFCTYLAYRTWQMRASRHGDDAEPIPSIDGCFEHICLVHGDLSPWNVMLSESRTVFLIDWEFAGYYPACLEAVGMRFTNDTMPERFIPASWARYWKFIAGPVDVHVDRFWVFVRIAVDRFSY
ncbi:unnamed protein product [Peniophora sp. CBMAI 1063]|nr:unnamed protein product [Peniophora sp. CBMAI 1063]